MKIALLLILTCTFSVGCSHGPTADKVSKNIFEDSSQTGRNPADAFRPTYWGYWRNLNHMKSFLITGYEYARVTIAANGPEKSQKLEVQIFAVTPDVEKKLASLDKKSKFKCEANATLQPIKKISQEFYLKVFDLKECLPLTDDQYKEEMAN